MARTGCLPMGFIALLAALAGCATEPPAPPARPPVAAARTIGDLPALRRCMDNLLVDYGTHDLAVIVEDLADPAQPGDAGARDQLIAAVSDMTQRSRAIRLVASDKDWSRTRSQMSQALQREPLALAPQYALRGSIRTLDAGRSGAGSLELDLTLLSTQDMSVVPGTTSRNAVSVVPPGAGTAGRAELRKFGAQFSLPVGAGESRAPALRALMDLAAIEVFGRLAKLPYWSCFGAGAAEPAVAAEIQDWYDTMAARPAEIIGYFQAQLRARRLYDGAIDGAVNPPLKEAVARYREALGLSREPKLSLDFFQAYLAADHRAVASRLAPQVPAAPVASTSTVAAAITSPVSAGTAPLAVRIAAGNDSQRFARGEAVQLSIRPSRDAHVYCFHQDENRKITRFFPNRFQRDSRVPSAAGLQLPGAMRFEIVMNPRGVPETVSCFATDSDVLAQLPAPLGGGDFTPLPVASMDQVRGAFLKATTGSLAQETFQIRPR